MTEESDKELIERLNKAPARYSFKIDVSEQSPEKIEEFLKYAKRRLKDRRFKDGQDLFFPN